jgi:hypothetical protein
MAPVFNVQRIQNAAYAWTDIQFPLLASKIAANTRFTYTAASLLQLSRATSAKQILRHIHKNTSHSIAPPYQLTSHLCYLRVDLN